MRSRSQLQLQFVALGLGAALVACTSEDLGLDGGASPTDAGETAVDAGADDAGAGACQTVAFDAVQLDVQQDVQTIYSARLSTEVGAGGPDFLVFNFVNINSRFGQAGIGTFSLSEAPNDNRGTCGDCISVFADQVTPDAVPAKVFFQSAGEIQLDVNPRTQIFRGRVAGLELVEVTIDGATLESTPVPGGECLRVEDFEVDYKFVPSEWTCDAALYRANDYMCNCDCGAPDPDCYCDPFMDPNCPQSIPDDCPMGTTCTAQGCLAGCDPFSNPVERCMDGELCAFSTEGPVCEAPGGRVNAAMLGQTCQGVGNLIQYCAIQNTVPAGVCDDFDNVCKPICRTEADCAMGEQCFTFAGGGAAGSFGWCRAAGQIPPEEWICDPEDYGDAQFCNCNCGAVDVDCFGEDELPVVGCNPGESCISGTCE